MKYDIFLKYLIVAIVAYNNMPNNGRHFTVCFNYIYLIAIPDYTALVAA